MDPIWTPFVICDDIEF